LLRHLRELISQISRAIRYSEKHHVVRRYFFLSAFDGALAAFGIVFGISLVNNVDPAVVVAAGFGASLAMLASGVAGAYITEEAESKRRVRELEEAMLVSMEDSIVAEASFKAAIITALINGLTAFGASALVLSPYIIALFYNTFKQYALYSTFAVALLILFTLGAMLARASKQNVLIMAGKMVVLGIIVIILSVILQLL